MRSIQIHRAAVLAAITGLISVAAANVGLDISCYNSGDDMSQSFDANNIDYLGEFTLEPHEISFSSKGESTAPECSYSLAQSFNGKTQSSSAQTDSGSLEWATKMNTGSDALGEPQFKLGASHSVENGILSSQFSADDLSVSSKVIVSKASYSEKISISPDRLAAVGQGSTIQESPDLDTDFSYYPIFENGIFVMKGKYYHAERGDGTPDSDIIDQNEDNAEEDDQMEGLPELPTSRNILDGFVQKVDVAGKSDWSKIESAAIGEDVAVNWKFAFASDLDFQPEKYSLGMAVGGASTKGFDVLEMRGVGSDIEMRRLPPGTVNAELLGSIDKILFDQKTDQYLQFVDDKTKAFYEEYPSSDNTKPVTWYSWDQKAFIKSEKFNGNDQDSGIDEFEYFKMRMAFDINSKESFDSGKLIQDGDAT